jgi:PH domain
VLKLHSLYYFRAPGDVHYLGVVHLRGASLSITPNASRSNCFSIKTEHRVYDLSANSVQEMKEWMQLVQNNVDHLSKREQHALPDSRTRHLADLPRWSTLSVITQKIRVARPEQVPPEMRNSPFLPSLRVDGYRSAVCSLLY